MPRKSVRPKVANEGNRNIPHRLIDELYKKPVRETGVNAARFLPQPPHVINQADLLYMPSDDGYKYALVVVDIGTRLTDAEPIKTKDAQTVLNALKRIYNRGILKQPKRFEVDNGKEFKGVLSDWLESKHVSIRYAKPYRHRQQAIVERRNQMIGIDLFKLMTAEELQTGHPSRQWTKELPVIIDNMNSKQKTKKAEVRSDKYQCEGSACVILGIGTMVRAALDEPIDVASGTRLHGRFRSTDIRWEIKPRAIKNISVLPGQPPLYYLDDGTGNPGKTAYTKGQLLPVRPDEIKPTENEIRPIRDSKGPNKWIVERIVSKSKQNGRIMYEVKWAGFERTTLEPRTELIKDIPDMIAQYEKNNKK